MTPITKIPLNTEPDPELESLKDSVATQRALDYYLKPPVSPTPPEKKMFLVSNDVTQEEALLSATDYLQCAITNAQNGAEHQFGPQRDLLLNLLFLVEWSKQLVERAIDLQQQSAR